MAKKKSDSAKESKKANKKTKAEEPVVENASTEATETPPENSEGSIFSRMKATFLALDRKKKFSVIAAPTLVILLLLFLTVRPLRIFALNLFSSADITIQVNDTNSEQPVVGVSVVIGDVIGETDMDGKVLFEENDFGDYDVMLSKNAYEPKTESISVTQSEQTFEIELMPTGTPYSVSATNWITGEAISDFMVSDTNGELTASSVEGEATLNIPVGVEAAELTVTADGFNQKTFSASFETDANGDILENAQVRLSKAGRHHFLSNRSGPIGLWSSNYDGTDARVVVEDLGRRTGRISMSISPDGKFAVLSAPIKGERNDDDRLLEELYVVNLENGDLVLADEGNATFSILEVENDRVVYSVELLDQNEVNRAKIKTYTFSSADLNTAFTSNSISRPIYINNKVYFVELKQEKRNSSYYEEGFYWDTVERTFFVLDLANNEFSGIQNSIGWPTITRSPDNQDIFYYEYWDSKNRESVWYEYNVGSGEKTKIDRRPDTIDDRPFPFGNPAPDGRQIWVETRDGRGTLVIGDNQASNEESIDTGSFRANYVVRWVDDNHVIVNGSEEGGKTGDFIVHVPTGENRLVTEIYRDTYYYRYGYYGY